MSWLLSLYSWDATIVSITRGINFPNKRILFLVTLILVRQRKASDRAIGLPWLDNFEWIFMCSVLRQHVPDFNIWDAVKITTIDSLEAGVLFLIEVNLAYLLNGALLHNGLLCSTCSGGDFVLGLELRLAFTPVFFYFVVASIRLTVVQRLVVDQLLPFVKVWRTLVYRLTNTHRLPVRSHLD